MVKHISKLLHPYMISSGTLKSSNEGSLSTPKSGLKCHGPHSLKHSALQSTICKISGLVLDLDIIFSFGFLSLFLSLKSWWFCYFGRGILLGFLGGGVFVLWLVGLLVGFK